jgi:hypothetical protein
MILFIGDKPSRKNLDPTVAFVGTKSYNTLIIWINSMNLDPEECVFINRVDENYSELVNHCVSKNYPVITLGLPAKEDTKQLTTDFYDLPHPSGLNRQLNRKDYLNMKLLECKQFILSKTGSGSTP